MTLKGIDVSYHQGRIDWKKVKNAGIQFVMLRAGYGRNNLDKQFHANANGCRINGIPFGVYWFSYAYTVEMARQEARYCAAAIEQYEVQYPVCYDLEYDSISYAKKNNVTISKTLATKMAVAFCEEVERLGYKAMNYANLDYAKRMFGSVPYDLWFARYNPTPGRSDMAIWQYSSSGAVPGITGEVDMNYCYKDYTTNDDKPQRTTIQMGDTGESVRQIQSVLKSQGWTDDEEKELKIDCVFGSRTKQALEKAQKFYGISEDGIWGQQCDSTILQNWIFRLQLVIDAKPDGIPGPDTLSHTPTISRYTNRTHKAVRIVQERLNLCGYPMGTIDGIAGPQFEVGVESYQRNIVKLDNPDGELTAEKNTWKALLGL